MSCDDGEHYNSQRVYEDFAAFEEEMNHGQTVYEGEWLIDKQVVDTARLHKDGTNLSVRLPEVALFHRAFHLSMNPDLPIRIDCHHDIQQIIFSVFGSSETTFYADFKSVWNAYQDIRIKSGWHESWEYPAIGSYSMGVRYQDVDYRIDFLGRNTGVAMLDISTKLWTLAIPIDKIVITNYQTGDQETESLPETLTLVYNCKN